MDAAVGDRVGAVVTARTLALDQEVGVDVVAAGLAGAGEVLEGLRDAASVRDEFRLGGAATGVGGRTGTVDHRVGDTLAAVLARFGVGTSGITIGVGVVRIHWSGSGRR